MISESETEIPIGMQMATCKKVGVETRTISDDLTFADQSPSMIEALRDVGHGTAASVELKNHFRFCETRINKIRL